MLRKENRLPKDVIFSRKADFSSEYFLLKKIFNDQKKLRVGIAVSKKIDKRAVVRNKIKRQFKECLVSLKEKIMPGVDLLFIVKSEALNKENQLICIEIEKALEKIKIIK